MPAIGRHVGARQFATLEMKQGGSLLGSLALNLGSVLLFALLWLLTLPLYFFPPLALAAQVALWGWLTARVMSYDALAAHASADERRAIAAAHRWPLLAIGMVSGAAGALPGIVWIGGALISVVLFPFLADDVDLAVPGDLHIHRAVVPVLLPAGAARTARALVVESPKPGSRFRGTLTSIKLQTRGRRQRRRTRPYVNWITPAANRVRLRHCAQVVEVLFLPCLSRCFFAKKIGVATILSNSATWRRR